MMGIPYKQSEFNMVIILPNARFGLNDVMKKLDFETIKNLKDFKKFQRKLVLLQIPKFRIEYETSVKENLRLLGGISEAFRHFGIQCNVC